MFKYLFLVFTISCSGYRFSQQDNPFAQYGISSLSVPMFYNYSNLSEVHSDFTRETYQLLSGFTGLKIVSGHSSKTDAILLGILRSPEKASDTFLPSNLRLAQSRAGEAIGTERENFYVPGTSDVVVYLQVILIKKPTEDELILLRSNFSHQIRTTSKIIFNEVIPLRDQFTREILDRDGVQVVGTQNLGVQRKTFQDLAKRAALNIRDMILYAF